VCHIDLDNSFFNFGVVGLAVDAPGNVYAAVASFDPATQGIYRIGRKGEGCERIPGTEDLGFADGLAFTDGLAFDKRGNLYVTEADEGAIYRIDRRGNIELWLQHPLLEGTGSSYGFVRIGANGIQYWKNSLIVANSELFLIVKVPILPNGDPGEPEILYDAFISLDPLAFEFFPDGIALDVFGNIYVADPPLSQVYFVAADGSYAMPLATWETVLDNPTSLAFGTGKGDRKNLFVVNFDLLTPEQEAGLGVPVNGDGPSLVKMGTGNPGNPLP
jgi:sugar lactone lactonase YvrE